MWLAYVCLTTEQRNSEQLQTPAGPWVLFVVLARGLATLPHALVFSLALYIMVFFVGENIRSIVLFQVYLQGKFIILHSS